MLTKLNFSANSSNDNLSPILSETRERFANGGRDKNPPNDVNIATAGGSDWEEGDERWNPEKSTVYVDSQRSDIDVTRCLTLAVLARYEYHLARKSGDVVRALQQANKKAYYLSMAIETDTQKRIKVYISNVPWLWSVRFGLNGKRVALHIPKRQIVRSIANNPACLRRDLERLDHWCHYTEDLATRPTQAQLAVWLKLLGMIAVPVEVRNRARGMVSRHIEYGGLSKWDLQQLKKKVQASIGRSP